MSRSRSLKSVSLLRVKALMILLLLVTPSLNADVTKTSPSSNTVQMTLDDYRIFLEDSMMVDILEERLKEERSKKLLPLSVVLGASTRKEVYVEVQLKIL